MRTIKYLMMIIFSEFENSFDKKEILIKEEHNTKKTLRLIIFHQGYFQGAFCGNLSLIEDFY